MLFRSSILTRNYPLISGMVIVIAVMWGISYLISDIAYTVADPRIRVGGAK